MTNDTDITQALSIIEGEYAVVPMYDPMHAAGQTANRIASHGLFDNYRVRRAPNTLDRQDDDLHAFSAYLADAGIIAASEIDTKASALAHDALAWLGMTWGIVAGFIHWLEQKGYAVGSINVRLTTIKVYAGLAKQAGTLSHDELASIRLIKGYKLSEGKHLDETRAITRLGPKKADATSLTREQAIALKRGQPDTPQGRRDAVLMCFLLDQGLRVSELALLTRQSLNMRDGTFVCERPKVHLVQLHLLTDDTSHALKKYLKNEKPTGQLLMGSRKGQETLTGGMSERAIKARVRYLGLTIGLPSLSPHDCRHAWATFAANAKTDIFALQEAGGWASLDMPRRYVARANIANAGVRLA